jgi:hypothetical protein
MILIIKFTLCVKDWSSYMLSYAYSIISYNVPVLRGFKYVYAV